MASSQSQIPSRMKGQTTCVYHKAKQLDFYCEQCQEPICPKCLSSTHKRHPVCELSEITHQNKQDIKNFIDKTEQNDLVQIGKCITCTDTLLKDNDSTFENLSHQLKMQTDKLKQDLDKLTAETLSRYQEMKDDNTKLIEKYKQELEMYEKQLKQQIQELKTVLQQGSHIQIYDASCVLYSNNGLPVKPVLGYASFTPNKNPLGQLELSLGKFIIHQDQTSTDQDLSISTSDFQGQTSTRQKRQGDKERREVTGNTLLAETKVLEEWRSPCNITSICATSNYQVWTSCYYSKTLTLLDRKGAIIQKVSNKAVVNDINLSPTTHRLWICDAESNIQELVSGQLTHRFKAEESKCILVTASNHIIVGMPKHISKFTTQGQTLLTTMAAGIGKPLVCSPHRIAECPVAHNVAVIDFSEEGDGGDGNKHVVVMDTDFRKLFIYSGDIPSRYKQTSQTKEKPFHPWGVVFDSMGNLIIGEYHRRKILLLSGSGEFLKVMHISTGRPWAIGLGRDGVLWAVFHKNVQILQYSNE